MIQMKWFTKVTRWCHDCSRNCLQFRSTWVHYPFLVGFVIFSFMCMFCRPLYVLLYFFFWPLCYLFFFDIRILITPLVSSNSSHPFGAPQFIPVLVGFVLLDLQCYVYALQNVVCPFVLFLLTIVLSALLRFTDSDYPFGIFKLFLQYTGN